MSEFRCCVVKIGKVEALPNSDFLEITTVFGEYPVIIKKGDYKEGDLASFICYDAIVPANKTFAFLSPQTPKDENGKTYPLYKPEDIPEKYRIIRAKKIRKTYSEGLLVPCPPGFKEGDDVVEFFGIKKREYEEEKLERGNDGLKTFAGYSDNEKNPKSFSLPYYDLESIAKYGYAFEEGEEVIITEKCEGENFSVIYAENKLWVKSRNYYKRNGVKPRRFTLKQKILGFFSDVKLLFIKPEIKAHNHWWEVPIRLNLEQKLKSYPNLAVISELIGGVSGFRYDCKIVNGKVERDIRVFDIYDTQKRQYLEWHEIEDICQKLELKTVPVLYRGKWKTDKSLYYLAEGKSAIGDHVREGFVMRSVPNATHDKLGRKIIKLKGRDYKLFKG